MNVPTYGDLRQSQTVAPDVNLSLPNGPNAQQIAGQQMQGLGESMQRAGEAAARIAVDQLDQANNLAARSLDIGVATKLNALQFDPQAGFMSKRGADAAGAAQDYITAAQKVRTDALAEAPNEATRQILDRIVTDRTMSAVTSIDKHASGEYNRFQVQTSDDRAKVSLQAGANDYTNEGAFQGNLGTALHEAVAQGAMLGQAPETVALQKQHYIDQAYQLRYEAWRAQDPVGALASFQANAGAISPLVRVQLYHQLFEASAPALALQVNAAGGRGVVSPAPATPGAPADGSQPRGVRNNNPGNIVQGGSDWQGAVQGSDPRFVSFDTPESGIRAMGKTLQTYQDSHGLNTVSGIVSRWAPATENNTAGYTQQVSQALGVGPNQPIDVHDPATMTGLVKAIIKQENGKQPYSDQQIALGLAATGSAPPAASDTGVTPPAGPAPATANAWRDPSIPTGNPVVDALPSDWKMHVMALARSQAQQDMAGAREMLRGKVQDAAASYMTNGFAPNPPTLAEFVQAGGQVEGAAQYAAFQNVARLGQQLQQVKTLPVQALDALLEQAKPTPGPGFADAQHNYETLVQAIDRTTTARLRDPIAYAQQTGSYGVQPLALDNPQSLVQQLSQRASVAGQIAKDYGTMPVLMSTGETRVLADALRTAPVEAQKGILTAVARGVGDIGLMKTTMQQIAPDQPVMALAGMYQTRGLKSDAGRDVADLMLRGRAILTPNKKTDGTGHEGGASLLKMPESKLLLSEFNSATGTAFAGREQAADLYMQATKAIYAAKSAEAGDYSGNLDTGRWKSAVDLATGGVQSYNGSSIVMPYGLPMDQFQARMKAQAPALAAAAVNASPDELRRLPLENVGDGKYVFKRGAGYLVDKNGRPVVANLGSAQ